MSYKSGYTGPQVSKAVKYMTHPNVGTVLTFDASANFPPRTGGDYALDSSYFGGNAERFLFVDSSNNMVYRWQYLSQEQWLETHDNLDEYPADGYSYVPCSGGGSGDLVWTPLD